MKLHSFTYLKKIRDSEGIGNSLQRLNLNLHLMEQKIRLNLNPIPDENARRRRRRYSLKCLSSK